MTEYNFDPIRPYYLEELPAALERIINNDQFKQLMNYLFPKEQHHSLVDSIRKAKNTHEFQLGFMLPVIRSILSKTSSGSTVGGIKNIFKDKGQVFIANHRDIILDSSILALHLATHGFETCKITWGSNLMISPFVVDIGKANRMITVYREGSPKEMLKNSQLLSAYIRQSVTEKKQTVWIAQKKGRSKDGNDITDVSVLKMLSLTGDEGVVNSLSAINLTPVTISYEWEPCDNMKVRELLLSEGAEYKKEKNEDFLSIIGGVVSEKGRIHMHIGAPLNPWLEKLNTNQRPNDFLKDVASLIDKQMHQNYMLWPSNYYAYDQLNNSTKYSKEYTAETAEKFNARLNKTLENVNGEKNRITELFLKLYANPVINKLGA
jgi:hypothetical protein